MPMTGFSLMLEATTLQNVSSLLTKTMLIQF